MNLYSTPRICNTYREPNIKQSADIATNYSIYRKKTSGYIQYIQQAAQKNMERAT